MKKSSVSKVWDMLKKSIFAEFLDGVVIEESEITSEDVSKLIVKLSKEKNKLAAKEKEEKKRKEKLEEACKKQEEKQKEQQHIEEVTSMDLPLDWENIFDSNPITKGVHAQSVSDALVMSLLNLGRVDIEYISSITGENYKSVICALKGSIYQNPDTWNECFYKGWETSEEYLSGNLVKKWKTAVDANSKYKGYFEDNIKALDKLIPESVSEDEIYITLGSPWVPVSVIDDFITHLLKLNHVFSGTTHDEITGTWEIPQKNWYWSNVAATNTYGTNKDVLFMIDTSGSMSNKMITAAYSEIKGAIDQFGGKLKGWLGFFDAAVIEPVPFEDEDEFKVIRPAGGGGTDFQIIFEYVYEYMKDNPPTSIIILTDGYAPFPKEKCTNGIPVLWLLNNDKVTPPWGKIARIKV